MNVLLAISATLKNFFVFFRTGFGIYICIGGFLFFILCLVYQAIQNPSGAINSFMIRCIDILLVPLPSTPDEYKLTFLLNQFAASYPVFGWGIVTEIMQGIIGILSVYLVVKVFKFLPFF